MAKIYVCDNCGDVLGEIACSNSKGGAYCSAQCANYDDSIPEDPSDIIANLVRRVHSLEQQLKDTQENLVKTAEELANVKHRTQPKEVEVVTFEKFLDSIADKVAERLVGGGR